MLCTPERDYPEKGNDLLVPNGTSNPIQFSPMGNILVPNAAAEGT